MTATVTDKQYRLLIGGEWVEGAGGTYDIVNPATEEVVAPAPEGTADDVYAAAAAAKAAFPAWSHTPPEERARLLQALAGKLRERTADLLPLVIAETGATLSVGSQLQVPQAAARFERYARGALQNIDIGFQPALMPRTPLAPGALMNAAAYRQPVGVVNVVTGSKPEVGAAMVDCPDIDMISFTGSTAVGVRIYEAG